MTGATRPPVPEAGKIVIMVDLTPLRSDGSNGGLKTAALSFLRGLAASRHPFSFVYLTSASSHREVRAFARGDDLIVCVREDEPWPGVRDMSFSREYFLPQPPADLPRYFGVDLCYSPFGALFYFSPGVPAISLIADLLHEDWPHGLDRAEREERMNYIGFSCANSSSIQCISRTGVESIRKHYNVPAEKLFYTYLPPHLPSPGPCAEKAGKPYFFYPANFWPHKNHDLLLTAYSIYRHRHGEEAWDLVLTGHPDANMARMNEFAGLLGLGGHVSFLGYVSREEMENLYRNAGALVFLSLHEGFGIPLLEAWHYGKPVISSDVFSLPEVGGESCHYVNPRDPQSIAESLSALSGSAVLAEELSLKGSQRLNLFNLEAEVEQLAQKILHFSQPAWKQERDRPGPLLELPTPADEKLWSFHFKPRNGKNGRSFSVCFGDCHLGSHSMDGDRDLRLHFRPAGRRLRIFAGEGGRIEAGDLFSEVRASLGNEIHLQLFQARP